MGLSKASLIGRIVVGVLSAALAAVVAAQDPPAGNGLPGAKQRPPADVASSTLTEKDMVETFAKLEAVLRKVTKTTAPYKGPSVQPSSKAATREQVILGLNGLYEMAKPAFKYTPNLYAFDPLPLTIAKGTPARAALEKLIAWQCAGKIGPLAANVKPTLTLDEFGDAIGFFAMRIADLTHMPSNKWSPTLNAKPQDAGAAGKAKSSTSAKPE